MGPAPKDTGGKVPCGIDDEVVVLILLGAVVENHDRHCGCDMVSSKGRMLCTHGRRLDEMSFPQHALGHRVCQCAGPKGPCSASWFGARRCDGVLCPLPPIMLCLTRRAPLAQHDPDIQKETWVTKQSADT